MRKFILLLATAAVLNAYATLGLHAQNRITVPFVGCKSDGQLGPVAEPHGHDVPVDLPANIATKLAWYKAQYGPGVLAPRGWHCFSTYGSNGSSLFVTPSAVNSKLLFSSGWKGLPGPALQASLSYGGTSGRFQVASAIARIFPAYSQFVRNIVAEGFENAADFPSGQYPTDKIHRLARNAVEFETPAMQQGTGTNSGLRPDSEPIAGVAILVGEEPDLFQLSIRTPARERYLSRIIIEQFEQKAPNTTL